MSVFSSATLLGRLLAPFVGGILLTLTYSNFDAVYLVCGVSATLALLAATRIHPEKESLQRSEHKSVGATMLNGFREVVSERRILAVSTIEAGQFFAYGAAEAFIPKYGQAVLALDDWQIGTVLGLMGILLMATKPLMGVLSDRTGRRLPIGAGLIVGAVALFSMFLANSFVSLAVVLMVFGVGVAMVTASTSPLITDLCKQKAYGSALGVLDTIMDIGQTLGPIIFGLLTTMLFYYTSFALVGVVLTILAVLFLVTVR